MTEERRLGTILLLIESKESISKMNVIITKFSHLIIGRQGISLRERDLNIISLVLEGNSDEIGAFSGQLGRLDGIKVKAAIMKS